MAKYFRGGKGRRSQGEKDLGRKGGGGKDLWEEKGEELRVGKGLRRKRGELNDLNRELGGKDLREERQKIWGKKALGGKGEK